MLTGSCLCEAVRFQISCELGPVQVWVGSMAPWFEISDELPRFAEAAPDASGHGAAS